MATILIVDDEPLTNEMLATFLRIMGHDAVEAYTCDEARVRLSYTQPDAILLDIMLPDGNGVEFCRELRQVPACAQVPILMISATSPPLVEESRAAGATDYLRKPIALGHLRQLLGEVGVSG